MAKVFVAEQITNDIVERFSGVIAQAEACTAVDTPDSRVASALLRDPRWCAGTSPLWDKGILRLKRWSRELVFSQPFTGPRNFLERAMVACGLDARLRLLALASAFLDDCLTRLADGGARDLELSLAADDPYLRDGFRTGTWLSVAPRTLNVRGLSGMGPGKRAARDWMAAQRWLRVPPNRRGRSRVAAPPRHAHKTVMVMAIARRSVKELESVLLELRRRGWRILVASYRELADRNVPLVPMDETIIPWNEATAGWGDAGAPPPPWQLGLEVMQTAPLSRRWLRRALEASWITGQIQLARHRALLQRWRPDVVFGYGADVPSLALQLAAEELGIASIYTPHGFEVPARSFYDFATTATALYGRACAEINQVGPHGQPFHGLVPTGHPPYDRLIAALERSEGRRAPLPGLNAPASRPHLVLVLAGWGFDLLCQLHQERLLRMIARSLPEDAFLICKLHPGYEERAVCQEILGESLPADSFRVVGEQEFTTEQLLAGCDVAVSNERSMVLTDAIVMGKPAIGLHHPESPLGSTDRNHPGKDFSRTCWIVEDAAGLREALTSLTHSEVARARLLSHRRAYLEHFVMGDDQSTRRLADLVESLSSGGNAGSYAARPGGP
jgi:hypothetical protein